jgi:hypothetical protein
MTVHTDQAGMPQPGAGGAAASDGLMDLLSQSIGYLRSLWPGRPGYAQQIGELRARLVEQRLQIAVLGQFKRGKSTFLNALLGDALLPTGVLPLTAVPTFIRWAAEPGVSVTYLDGSCEELATHDRQDITAALYRLVTEEGNPENEAHVARVDLGFPAPVLSHGIVLIDTPGIGSTFQHNTDTAMKVLPACDAAFFVLSSDPPVTAVELDYLDQIRPTVARLFFILNKIDYLDLPDRPIAIDFLRRRLRERMPAENEIPVFALSARHGLEGKQAGDAREVAESGLGEVETYLAQFLAREKNEALRRAVTGKTAQLFDAIGMDIALGVRALEMPLEDLEQRAGQFGEALRDIERQKLVARDLLAGDRRRAVETLEERAAALRQEARAALMAALDRALAERESGTSLEAAGKAAIAAAIPEFFGPKLEQVSHAFAAEVEATLAQHVGQAERLIAAVRETAAALFEIPSIPAAGSDTFVMAREPFWVTQKWDETIGALAGGAIDKMLPSGLRIGRIRKKLAIEVDELVQRNVENLRWATLQNLDDAFRRFTGWFDERLAETIGATHGAIDAALTKRREHAEQAQDELAQLREASDWITTAKRELADLRDKPKDEEPAAELLTAAAAK